MQVNTNTIQFKRLKPEAILPTKSSSYAAGYDLYACDHCTIQPFGKALIPTGWSVALPFSNLYIRIAPRSGLAWKHHIGVGAGVIDSDYKGEMGVVLFNHDPNKPFEIQKGDRIAQMIIETCHNNFQLQETMELHYSFNSNRDASGFGSSGK